MDQSDFDPYEVDADGLPLVYNEERIGAFLEGQTWYVCECVVNPDLLKCHINLLCIAGELTSRWARFAAISGKHAGQHTLQLYIAMSNSQL